MLQIVREPDCDAVSISVSGSFSREDHTQLIAFLEDHLSEDGKLHILVDLEAVVQEGSVATFPDIIRALPHRRAIHRVAIVGDEILERMRPVLAEGLPDAEIQFFRPVHLAQGWAWVCGRV